MKTRLHLITIILLIILSKVSPAQPLEPIVTFDSSVTKYGFYLLTPYYIKKSMPPDSIRSKQLILDGQGKLIWYRETKIGSDFKLHKNGKYSYWNKNNFYIMNEKFKIIDSVGCAGGIETDPHELQILPNGHYLLLGKIKHIEDLSKTIYINKQKAFCSKKAVVKYDIIQELDQNKKLVFQWNLKDHFKPEDVDAFYLNDTLNVDLTHCNSIDIDNYGNYLLSVRYYNQILKINRKNGEILWRMGGKLNNINFINDTIRFLGQHFPRYTKMGTITLFDNGYNKDSLCHNVRAMEYKVDDIKKTAELVWSYSNKDRIISEGNGCVQRLDDNKTMISYGKVINGIPNRTFQVIDSSGKDLLKVAFLDTMGTYRTYFITTGVKIILGNISSKITHNNTIISAKPGYKKIFWNTGEKTMSIMAKKPGIYYAFVSFDGQTFVRTNEIKVD